MAVGLVVGVDFEPSPTDFQDLLDRGLINADGFEFVTLELAADEASNREKLRALYEAACIKQGWEAGLLYSPTLTYAEVLISGKVAIVVRPEGSEDEAWVRRAAEDGDTKAMLTLAANADEVGDRRSALKWYERAAASGDAQAMFDLGAGAYEAGDVAIAMDWWDRAAATGNPKAMFNLGVFAHQNGDHDTARRWLQRACEAGDEDARAALAAAYPGG